MVRNSLFLLILFCSLYCTAQSENLSVTGVWQDSTGMNSPFTECIAIITEDDNGNLTFSHALKFNQQLFIEQGTGNRQGSKLAYHVDVMHGIPGWSTSGDHELILSKDGNTLRGNYKDNLGNSGPITFIRKE